MPKVCDICEWSIVGKPLNQVYFTKDNKKIPAFWACNFCYRGLYGFRYFPQYLKKAVDMIESFGEGGTFLERARASR